MQAKNSFKLMLSLFFLFSCSFPLKSQASVSINKKSQIYKEALVNLMSNSKVEKVLEIVFRDENQTVTSTLKSLNIDLEKLSNEKTSGEFQDEVFKVLADEYIKARSYELQQFSLYMRNNLTDKNKYALKAALKAQIHELQRDIDYFRTLIGYDSNSLAVRISVGSIFGAIASYSFYIMSLAFTVPSPLLATAIWITTGALGLFSSYVATLQVYDFTSSKSISEKSKSNMKQINELKLKSEVLLSEFEKYKEVNNINVLP